MKSPRKKALTMQQWKEPFERITQVKRVLLGFRSLLDQELQPLGITAAQLRLLRAVQDAPGISGAKLADICSVTPQTGQQLMMKLEANGWITREKNPANERVLLARLTKKGEKMLQHARAIAEVAHHKLWQRIDPAKLAVFDEVLAISCENLKGLELVGE
ncbi:MarR family winged helix-turn-helix transcriptional regulator [Granulicella mallensis]|jgi:DNA-binding MarR family transcriptional regulator|uniref:DNA-binding MarR family transcriptional regulator n=1 Tax=Granulicella mallensis TaxID=940614 RepID=A0A7W7ZUK1_9BACT|nr:MarR family transcriptional regulator [Granulicella mallensis]MBB5065546.1 DNA-binding MarR family transcriptional regulator [Granulicella mallensis]